jgi:hypothetical protein
MNNLFFPLLVLSFFVPLKTEAQMAVSIQESKFLYAGIEHHISIVASEINCNDLHISVRKSLLKLTDTPCNFKIVADKPGFAEVIAAAVQDGSFNEIGREQIRVKPLPIPEVILNGSPAGYIPTEKARAAKGISLVMNDFPFDIRIQLQSYEITFIGSTNESFQITGPYLSEDVIKRLLTAEPNQVIVVNLVRYLIGEQEFLMNKAAAFVLN